MKRYYKAFLRPSRLVAAWHIEAVNQDCFVAQSNMVALLVATPVATIGGV
jgi:hypothetical protein